MRLRMALFDLKRRLFSEIFTAFMLVLCFVFMAYAFLENENIKKKLKYSEYISSCVFLTDAAFFSPKKAGGVYLTPRELQRVAGEAALSCQLNAFVRGAENLTVFKINDVAARLFPIYGERFDGTEQALVSKRLKKYFPSLGVYAFDFLSGSQFNTEDVEVIGYLDEYDTGINLINSSVFAPCDILMCGAFATLENCAAAVLGSEKPENAGFKVERVSISGLSVEEHEKAARVLIYLTLGAVLITLAAISLDTLLRAQSDDALLNTCYTLGESLGSMLACEALKLFVEIGALGIVFCAAGAVLCVNSAVPLKFAVYAALTVEGAFFALKTVYAAYRAARFKRLSNAR